MYNSVTFVLLNCTQIVTTFLQLSLGLNNTFVIYILDLVVCLLISGAMVSMITSGTVVFLQLAFCCNVY